MTRLLGEAYRILGKLGEGGMADVYEVEHLRLESRFAAKVLRRDRQDWVAAVRRFEREARILAGIHSEHVVRVLDMSSPETDPPFYVMELLEGHDLRALLGTGRLTAERAVGLVSDACLGLAAAHASGLVHRDLKPENLFVTYRDSGEELCKLLDFGVARIPQATTTEPGAMIGTLRYMAPEQIDGTSEVGARADIYALGAILFECLTGRPPHEGATAERLLFQILNATPVSVDELRREVDPRLVSIVARALRRDPRDRFASALDLKAALDALRPEEDPRTSTTLSNSRFVAPVRQKTARFRWPLALTSSSLLLFLAAQRLAGPGATDVRTGPPAPPASSGAARAASATSGVALGATRSAAAGSNAIAPACASQPAPVLPAPCPSSSPRTLRAARAPGGARVELEQPELPSLDWSDPYASAGSAE